MIPDRTDPAYVARIVASLRRDDIPEFLRAIDVFERCGVWSPDEAGTLRIAVRAMLAELSEPEAEA